MGQNMADEKKRLSHTPVPGLSLKEKERRYSLLRGRLMEAGLSGLIVYGGTQLGVPVHYPTQV